MKHGTKATARHRTHPGGWETAHSHPAAATGRTWRCGGHTPKHHPVGGEVNGQRLLGGNRTCNRSSVVAIKELRRGAGGAILRGVIGIRQAGGSGKMTSRLSPSKALATVRRGLSGKNHDSIFFLEFHFFLCSDSMLVPQRLPSKSPSSPSHFLGIKKAMRDVRRRLRRREGWRKSSRL